MRHLYIKFVDMREEMETPTGMATRTYVDRIPENEYKAIYEWVLHGGPLWGKDRKRVKIVVIKTRGA